MTEFRKEPNLDQRAAMTGELSAADLDAVNGGSLNQFMELLSNIIKAQGETLKTISRNIRG